MQSEVGEGWPSVSLRDIANISMGETLLSKDLTGRGVPVFSANTDRGPWGYTDQNRKTLKRGTVVIGARGSIGFPRLPPFDEFTCTQTTISVEPKSTVDSGYLHCALLAADLKGLAALQAIPMLTIGALAPLTIKLPPLDEQRRIAEVLRSLDVAIEANREVIQAGELAVDAIASQLLAAGSAAGETIRVDQLGRVVTGRTPPPAQTELWVGDLPFFTPGDLTDGVISVAEAQRSLDADGDHGCRPLPSGSVLVTCIGSTIGKTAISRTACVTNQQINAICCEPDVSGFVYLVCRGLFDEIAANAGRQAVPIINKSTFAALQVAKHELSYMREVSAAVDKIDSQMQCARAALDTIRDLKSSVADVLLSGRLRVPA